MGRIDILNLKKYLKYKGDNKLARIGHVNHVINNTIAAPENPSNDDILIYNSLTDEWEAESSSNYTYEIGEYVPAEGGVIFHRYIEAGVENYLVTSIVDESISQDWSNISGSAVGSAAETTWDGQSNSTAVVGQIGHLTSAASLCLNSTAGGQNDWYLPSIDEISLLYQNRFHVHKSFSTIVGASNIANAFYWSSTEANSGNAYLFNFVFAQTSTNNKSNTHYVRAIRTFTL